MRSTACSTSALATYARRRRRPTSAPGARFRATVWPTGLNKSWVMPMRKSGRRSPVAAFHHLLKLSRAPRRTSPRMLVNFGAKKVTSIGRTTGR